MLMWKHVDPSFLCVILVSTIVILYSGPSLADPPKIHCTVKPSAVEQGDIITVMAESDKRIEVLRVFIKEPQISDAPMTIQSGTGSRTIAVDMRQEKGNRYVGHIDTSDLRPGEAVIELYGTDSGKEHAIGSIPVRIR
jgi:hypothetical protein